MSEGSNFTGLRERLASTAEDRLGQALSDILESSILTGAISRAFDVRERAVQAQELAMGLLNLPSAADIERLTRRLRSVSQRLETIEDGLQRIERTLKALALEQRLGDLHEQLQRIAQAREPSPVDKRASPAAEPSAGKRASAAAKSSEVRKRASSKPSTGRKGE